MHTTPRILHLDTNDSLLWQELENAGFENFEDYTSSKQEIEKIIANYHGIIIRSRFKIDKTFLDKATALQFIARVGAGLESIDCAYAQSKGITLIAAPEGNSNAVGEHALGLLLNVMNNLNKAHQEIIAGQWNREPNRGHELEGQTVGIIGYGNMGKAFAKKLQGFAVEVLCYDILNNVGDKNAKQVSLLELQQRATVLSLHTPWTPQTNGMINKDFINQFANNFWVINTARGNSVITADLVEALINKKILGAGLDVLEYEKLSFETLSEHQTPPALDYLLKAKNVVLTPHIAGWTVESKKKLAQVIAQKIISLYKN